MQHFSYKAKKKRLKTRDGSTRREKNTCRERFKGNVGLHTSTLQSHRQSDTNSSHKNTHTTHKRLYRVITKYCAKRKSTSTRTLFCKEECVYERDVLAQKKSAEVGARGDALYEQTSKPPKQDTMRNQEKEGMREEREKKSTKRKKRTLFLKISFCREALFIFYFA